MISRREFLAAGGAFFLGMRRRRKRGPVFASLPGGTLDPTTIPKYTTTLFRLPAMPGSLTPGGRGLPPVDYYQLAIRQFHQQVLPAGFRRTTVWGYGDVHRPDAFHWPAFTIEARTNSPVRVKWVNDLVDSHGSYLAHLLTVDPTIHWSNPPGGLANRDTKPGFPITPAPYTGPVPLVSHLHGAHSQEHSDGYPEAWFLPAADDIPAGFAKVGSLYEEFRTKFEAQHGVSWEQGTSTFQYQNDQEPTTLWYHDHSLGISRLNVYAGLAGFYLIREPNPPGRAGRGVALDRFDRRFEVALMIQDRSFNADGSLFYPDSRFFFDGFGGPYIPFTDTPPIWNPEFFGNTMVVNGNTWPVMEVEPRRYRLRILNASNSRFLILKMVSNPLAPRPANPALPFWQIGADGGFLPAAVQLGQLLMALAERADVIVDFSEFREGDEIYLINEGPDEPFGGGAPGVDFISADPQTTGQVMKFKVVRRRPPDFSPEPSDLELPSRPSLGTASLTRPLSMNRMDTAFSSGQGPVMAALGTMAAGMPVALRWGDALSENPQNGATEVWEIYNFTEDAHPIHVHLVQFEVVNRQPLLKDSAGEIVLPVLPAGPPRSPEAWESGRKDTLIAYPGEITRLKAKFDIPGLFVWHCHILEHEDNEMMRPYRVT